MNRATPKFWTKLFRWFCDESFFEELQGDLEERFSINAKEKGLRRAKHIYAKEVIKMVRPSVVKFFNTKSLMTSSVLRMHWRLSVRSLKSNKVFSVITTLGFASAISISLFLVNIIYSGYSLDGQHDNLERIQRIATEITEMGETKNYASTPFGLKERVSQDIPGFDLLTHVNRTLSLSFQQNDSPITIDGIYVDKEFFEVFNFPMVKGRYSDLFKDINSVIITEEASKRLFGEQNPIGKITTEGQVVRAVIQSPKNKSHIPFQAIGNIDALPASRQNWTHRERNYLYGLISKNIDRKTIESRLVNLSETIDKGREESQLDMRFFLQPITGLMFEGAIFNEIGSSVGREGLIIFSALTILLVAMACFNYTNMSFARALIRTKEVGIRKVVGSTPGQIITQFLIETSLFSSLGFSIGLIIYSYYSNRIAHLIPFPFLEISNYQIIFVFIGFALITGLIAGIFPALFFSRISPLALFNKGNYKKPLSMQGIRKLLVGVQVTVSMFCIVLLSLIIDQNRLLRSSPTGIQSDQLLIVNSTPETVNLLIQEFEKTSGVVSSTVVSSLPVIDFPNSITITKPGMSDSLNVRSIHTDQSFDDVFRPRLRLGSFFSSASKNPDYREVVVSTELLQKLNIPENEALGTLLNGSQWSYQIIGVLEETIGANPLTKQDESIILINTDEKIGLGRLVVRLESHDFVNTYNELEKIWEEIFVNDNFQASLFESESDLTFKDMYNAIKIITFLGGCIILISLLGQLGMALFNAQSRVKEIGIRKVMGAAMKSITGLILKSTTYTITIAALIATPLAYLVFVNLVASEVRNPLNVNSWSLIKGVIALAALVLIIVISQTWRVAKLNPAETLRNE